MESYDLFGDDVSGSMLEGLSESLGVNEQFDSSAAATNAPGANPGSASQLVLGSRDAPNAGANAGGGAPQCDR